MLVAGQLYRKKVSRASGRPRLPALLVHGDRARVLALLFWRGVAVRLLPCRYVDNRLGELIGVPGALGVLLGHRAVTLHSVQMISLPLASKPEGKLSALVS
jgi:hypothetical protein